MRRGRVLAAALMAAGCSGGGGDGTVEAAPAMAALTVAGPSGTHRFRVEVAATAEAQAQGLMYRTAIPADGGMLFAPYPPGGGGPKRASFWMRNTPQPLDIVFIRADGTIARIAENTTPFSDTRVDSGEPVGAVLELRGGRALELGIDEGDTVRWQPLSGSSG
jgi:uncharacterized protein